MKLNNRGRVGTTILIIILLIGFLGCAGYIVYDKVISKEESKTEEKTKDITKSDLAKSLHSNMNKYVYYEEKMSIDDADDARFIANSVADYRKEKGSYDSWGCDFASDIATLEGCIRKESLYTYIKEKYNSDLKYDLKDKSNNIIDYPFTDIYGNCC